VKFSVRKDEKNVCRPLKDMRDSVHAQLRGNVALMLTTPFMIS